MKKISVLAVVMALTISACSAKGERESTTNVNVENSKYDSAVSESISVHATGTEASQDNQKETTTIDDNSEKETTVSSTTTRKRTVTYISERAVYYRESDDRYDVLFCLLDEDKEYMDASGTAQIKIVDALGNVLYDEMIMFTEKQFTGWTFDSKDNRSYGCWLTIPRGSLKGACSPSGTLTLSVDVKDCSFAPHNITIFDLPQKEASIELPNTPINVVDSRYRGHTSYATITDISYETTNSYDGEMYLTFKFVVTLDKQVGEEDTAYSIGIGYKFIDSQGFVAKTGSIYTNTLRVGEKSKEETFINGLDPSESYRLVFEEKVT